MAFAWIPFSWAKEGERPVRMTKRLPQEKEQLTPAGAANHKIQKLSEIHKIQTQKECLSLEESSQNLLRWAAESGANSHHLMVKNQDFGEFLCV